MNLKSCKASLAIAAAVMSGLFATSCALFGDSSIPAPEPFFTLKDGSQAKLYTLKNDKGMSVQISDFGGVIYKLNVPDKNGKVQDVILGFSTPQGYENPGCYFGALIGRYANRIGKGSFELDGKTIQIKKNENDKNTLHGGDCYAYRLWDAKQTDDDELELTLTSPDGDAGFPGNLKVKAVYELDDDNELKITMTAKTDATTAVNLTSHGYFNLSGHKSGPINDHDIYIYSDSYQECDKENIPTGNLIKVAGTPYDFRNFTSFGDAIKKNPNGYDNSFIVKGKFGELRRMASARSRTTGIRMDVYSNDAAVQFYSAGGLNNTAGKDNASYQKFGAFCFEPQRYVDSVNHPEYPTSILKPGEKYKQEIVLKFSISK